MRERKHSERHHRERARLVLSSVHPLTPNYLLIRLETGELREAW